MTACTITYESDKNRFILRSPPYRIGEIMRLPMRRFLKKAEVWVVPVTRLNCEKILEFGDHWSWVGEARDIAEKTQHVSDTGRTWPTWYKHGGPAPFAHQRDAEASAYAYDEYFLSMEQGTAKSKVAIDVACAHRLHQRIDICVIVAPLTVTRTWEDQLAIHCPLPYVVVRGNRKFKGVKVGPEQIGFALFGYESFSQGDTYGVLLEWARLNKFMMVLDESHWIKSHDSLRTIRLRDIGTHAKVKLCLTGTPLTKNIMDLYAQYEFLNPNIIGVGDFYSFRNRYAIMGGFKNKQVVGYDNTDELMGFLRPRTYSITKAECLDLPPKIYTRRYVDLSPTHRKLYDQLKKNLVEEVTLKNVLVKMLRCRQLVGGFLQTTEQLEDPITGKVKSVSHTLEEIPPAQHTKLQALLEELRQVEGSVIIFVQWKPEIGLIASQLPEDQVIIFTGDVDPDTRQQLIHDFQDGKKRYFLSTIAAGGIGTTLTRAQTVCYFSNTDSYATRAQSEDRAHRAGTVHSVTYIDFIANRTVDETLIKAYEQKQDLAGFVQEQMRLGTEAIALV